MTFQQAKFYHPGRRGWNGDGRIHGVVAHDMEAPEKGTTAESVANYFATTVTRPSSAEWCFDNNSQVQCVRYTDEAYHAPPASRWTIGYEHAGYATQTRADWADPFSTAMLQLSALQLAKDAQEFKFPLRFLSIDDLKAGRIDGVTTHNNVSKAWGQSTHSDPGPGFPMEVWLNMAQRIVTPTDVSSAAHGRWIGFRAGATDASVAQAGGLDREVTEAQFILTALAIKVRQPGMDPGGADGDYGSHSQGAVVAFKRWIIGMQRAAGQTVWPNADAMVGTATIGMLRWWNSR